MIVSFCRATKRSHRYGLADTALSLSRKPKTSSPASREAIVSGREAMITRVSLSIPTSAVIWRSVAMPRCDVPSSRTADEVADRARGPGGRAPSGRGQRCAGIADQALAGHRHAADFLGRLGGQFPLARSCVEPGNLSAKPGIFGAQKAGIGTVTGNYPGIVNELARLTIERHQHEQPPHPSLSPGRGERVEKGWRGVPPDGRPPRAGVPGAYPELGEGGIVTAGFLARSRRRRSNPSSTSCAA